MQVRTRSELLREIKNCEERIEDLKTRGDEACSKYDLMFGYNANFYLNVCTLPANHLQSYKNQLAELDRKEQKVIDAGIQLAFF